MTTRRYKNFSPLLRRFIEHLEGEGFEPQTVRDYAGSVRRFILWAEGDFHITPERIRTYADSLRAEGISWGRRRSHRAALEHFFGWIAAQMRTPRLDVHAAFGDPTNRIGSRPYRKEGIAKAA